MAVASTTPDPFEESGYLAGFSGKRLEDASLWSDAWNATGQNLVAWVIAGWVAGRATARIKQETEELLRKIATATDVIEKATDHARMVQKQLRDNANQN